MYTLHLYLFICWWTFRLLPCPGYCQQCCYEHWHACVFSNWCFHFLQISTLEWSCQIVCQLCYSFFEEAPHCLTQRLHRCAFPPAVYKGSLFSTSSPVVVICGLFDDKTFWQVRGVNLSVILMCIWEALFLKNAYFFLWLSWVLVAACWIFQLQPVGSSSLIRDRTQALGIGSAKS